MNYGVCEATCLVHSIKHIPLREPATEAEASKVGVTSDVTEGLVAGVVFSCEELPALTEK
jgi:hypothetical protein